jgi:hypothetical protein
MLALLLAASMVVPAFAVTGSYQWDDGTTHYTASAYISNPSSGGPVLLYPTSGNGVTYHYQNSQPGYDTIITVSPSRTFTRTWSGSTIPQIYRDKVIYALASINLGTPHYYTFNSGDSIIVPWNKPTGYYAIAKNYYTPSGTWQVVSQPLSKQESNTGAYESGVNTVVSSGNIYNALGALFGSYYYKAL